MTARGWRGSASASPSAGSTTPGTPCVSVPCMESVALSNRPVLDVNDIHLDVSPAAASNAHGFLPNGTTLEQWEDEMIREALRRANGNKSQAARLLGLSRNALRYRLSKIGIGDEGEKENEE